MVCPLCPPHISLEEHDLIWYKYQETMDYDAAADLAANIGLDINAKQITAHLKNHRWIQPAPQGNLRRGVALEKANSLPNERLRVILRLLSRVRALSGTQIAETVYWNGDPNKWHSHRNQCYRDLRRLLYADLIYRWTPTNKRVSAMSQNRADNLYYFLGRDGAPYVEERDGYQLTRRDWITRPELAGEEFRVMHAHQQAEVAATLQRQGKKAMKEGALPVLGHDATVSFNPLNWWSAPRANLKFDEPVSGISTLTTGGFAAVGIEIPSRKLSTLAPFFYDYDAGTRTPDKYADDLLAYLALSRTTALSERYGGLPTQYSAPTLIVCRDGKRIRKIQQELSKRFSTARLGDERPPVLVVTDAATFQTHGMTGECWLSLWDTENTGKRLSLLEVLLRTAMPLIKEAPYLSAQSELLFDANAARKAG